MKWERKIKVGVGTGIGEWNTREKVRIENNLKDKRVQLGPQKGEFSHLVASLASQDSKKTIIKTPSSHHLLQYELFLGPPIVG